MACTASSLLSSAAANGFFSLDERTILLAICGSLNPAAGNPTATQTLAAATTYGLYKLSDQDIYAALASYLCSQSSCVLATTIVNAEANGLMFLQYREVLIGILQSVSTGNAAAMVSAASTKGYQSLSDEDLVIAVAQLTIKSASTLPTLLTSASTTGFYKISRAILLAVILQLYCDLPAVVGNFRITTPAGDFRVTAAGDNRIWV